MAEAHLEEARKAHGASCSRAVFSRSYYAVYNASKAVRYIVRGVVSLNADDHGKASADLPDDLPNAASWAQQINELYQHRLRADYDNWSDTQTSFTLSPADCISVADTFLLEAKKYLNDKHGAQL